MKLITIKFILTLTLVFGVMAWSQEVQATSFTGYVLTSTNAPVAGVWLKVHYEWLTDNYIYIQTNTNGLFTVDTNDSGSGTADIDLNPDTPSVPRKNGCPFCYVSNGNYGLNFIMPYNWSGTVVVPTWTGYFSLGSSGAAEYPIRLHRTRSISGDVFIDTNGNGLKNGGETGYNSNGAIILGIIDTLPAAGTTTDSEGHYEMRENNQIAVGGSVNDVPTLLNEGTHTLTLTIPLGYKMLFPQTPTPSGPEVTLSTNSIGVGGTLAVNWFNNQETTTDWLSLAQAGSANNSYVDWKFTSSCSRGAGTTALEKGTCFFTVNTAGTYELRLFAQNSYTRLATSEPLQVNPGQGNPPPPSSGPVRCEPLTNCGTATCSTTTCTAGSVITVPVNLVSDTVVNFGLQLNN